MLPFSLGSSVLSAVTGVLITSLQSYRPIMWFSWATMTLGFGLMILLSSTSSTAIKVIFPLIAAIGVGGLFQAPLIALQAAMPLRDMATSTATLVLIRMLGGTIGISVGQAIWSSEVSRRIKGIEGFDIGSIVKGGSADPGALTQAVRVLKDIQPESVRNLVLSVYAKSISTIWIVDTPLLFVGFLMGAFILHNFCSYYLCLYSSRNSRIYI